MGLKAIKKGMVILYNDEPAVILSAEFVRMQQRKPTLKTQLKNLITGKIIPKTFLPAEVDSIEEANIEKKKFDFIYKTREEVCFSSPVGGAGEKICLSIKDLGEQINYLKKGISVVIVLFEGKPVSLELPVKISFKVIEAIDAVKGNTVSGSGIKIVKLETGFEVSAPMFIKNGDNILINTETGEYDSKA